MLYYVYVLKNEEGRRYIGMSYDPQSRLKEHNSGKTKSTKGFRPWELVYQEEFNSRLKAREREKYLKSGIGREYLDRMIKR